MTKRNKRWYELWLTEEYIKNKKKNFKIVDDYLDCSPKRILDIGCGFAYESKWFQEKYNCELYLLEGHVNNNPRQIQYGNVENFAFYNDISELKSYWNSQGLKYNFVNANNQKIDKDINFDLVYSFLSCGYHYPADVYKTLIKKHTNSDSKIIMDVRFREKQNIEILETIVKQAKSSKVLIKFTG